MTKVTPKQRIVLDSLMLGFSWHEACNRAGVSQSDENRNAFMARLVANGLVKLVPVEGE